MRDFTLLQYRNLLTALLTNGYSIQPNVQVQELHPKSIILRHDIDAVPLRALAMASLEYDAGVRSSYFFKTRPDIFIPEIIQQIGELQHTIGYHYEDLAYNHGNYSRAISDFERNLDIIRKVYPVTTICADGDPLSKYNNLWLWEKYDYKKFGITHEMYLDLDYNRYAYYTDTGRNWNADQFNVWDHVQSTRVWPHYHHTSQIIHAIERNTFPAMSAINLHPQRWNDNLYDWAKELGWQNLKNGAKWGLIHLRKLPPHTR